MSKKPKLDRVPSATLAVAHRLALWRRTGHRPRPKELGAVVRAISISLDEFQALTSQAGALKALAFEQAKQLVLSLGIDGRHPLHGEVLKFLGAISQQERMCSQLDQMLLRSLSEADEILRTLGAGLPEANKLDDWEEDHGFVLWWRFPVDEPPWVGTPLDSDWPGYHTHWTRLPPEPEDPSESMPSNVAKFKKG